MFPKLDQSLMLSGTKLHITEAVRSKVIKHSQNSIPVLLFGTKHIEVPYI